MPRIRPYEQQVSAEGSIPSQRANGSDFGGPGLTNLGGAVQSAGQDAAYMMRVQQHQDRQIEDRIEAQKRQASHLAIQQLATDTLTQWTMDEQERQKQARPDGSGHLEEAIATGKQNVDGVLEQVLNDPHNQILHEDLPSLRLALSRNTNHIVSTASVFAATSGGQHQLKQFNGTLASMQNAVRADPSLLGLHLERVDDLIGGLSMMSRGDIPDMTVKARSILVDATLDGKIDQLIGPSLTNQAIATLRKQVEDPNNIWQKESSPAGYAKALDRLSALAEHTEHVSMVIAADSLKERVREAYAGVDNGLTVKEAGYEKDSAKRTLLERSILEARAVGEVARTMKRASFNDQMGLMQAMGQQLEKPGNYDLDKSRMDAAKAIFANRYQAIQHDAAGVAAEHEVVKAAYDAIDPQDPSTVDAYVTATKAEQQRIAPYQPPVLLTKDQVGQVRTMLDNIERGPRGADDATKIIGDQYRLWGKYWPEVSAQLVKDKALTDAQSAAARMIADPLKHADLRVLLSASQMKPKEIEDLLPHGTVGRVEQSVNDRLRPFYDAMAGQSNGTAEMSRQFNAVKTLALGYMLRDRSLTEPKAAQQAADVVMMNDFHWQGTYHIPKQYEPSIIARGVRAAMRDLPVAIVPPKDISGLREADRRAATQDALQSSTRWVTNADNTGVVLQWADRDKTAVMIESYPFHRIENPDVASFGKMYNPPSSQIPLSYTWEELQRMGVK